VYENITFDISALCSVTRGANEPRLQKLIYPTVVLYNPDDKPSPLIRRLSQGLFHVVCPGLCGRPGAGWTFQSPFLEAVSCLLYRVSISELT